MFNIFKVDKSIQDNKDPLDISNSKYHLVDYIDYIDDKNSVKGDYKYKSVKSALEKLLQQFDNDLIASVNSTLVLNDSIYDSSSNSQEDKHFLLTNILSESKEQPAKSADDDWADYISRLGKLNKVLSTITSTDVIPYSNRINKHLIISLNRNLPSGVHINTLQIYLQIFNILNLDNLNNQANLWIPGLLTVVQYASLSVKPILLTIFKDWILRLDVGNLRLLLNSLLRSLISGIDQDSDDFVKLINELKTLISDDWLFMSSFYKILMESGNESESEIKMNALMWLNEPINEFLDLDVNNELFLKAMTACIASNNGVLCSRGYLDFLLIKKVFLNNTSFFEKEKAKDKFLQTLFGLLLNKELSINRRVYQLLIPFNDEAEESFVFFGKYLEASSLSILEHNFNTQETVSILRLLIIKWEPIGIALFKKLVVPLMHNVDLTNSSFIFNISELFEIVDSTTIVECLLKTEDISLIDHLIDIVKEDDEEMIVKHFPMVLLYLFSGSDDSNYQLILKLLDRIPDRAFFTIGEKATVPSCENMNEEDIQNIHQEIKQYYYNDQKRQHNLPYQMSDLLHVAVYKSYRMLMGKLANVDDSLYVVIQVFIAFYLKLPQFQEHEYIDYSMINSHLLALLENEENNISYKTLLSLIQLYKTTIFNKTFKFNKDSLKSINNSLNVVKTFKIIISKRVYPMLFEMDKRSEYISILNNFITINEKFVNKFLLESFIKDDINTTKEKLSLLELIIFNMNHSLLSFMKFIDHLLDSQEEIIYRWLYDNLVKQPSDGNLNKVLEYYSTNLIKDDNAVFLDTVSKLISLLDNVLKDEVLLLGKETLGNNLKVLLQDNNIKFDSNINTYQGFIMNILLRNINSDANLSTIVCLNKVITGDEYYIINTIIDKTYKVLLNNNSIKNESDNDKISVALINLLIKLITYSNMSGKNDIIIKYLDFIVSSIDLIKDFDVITSFINLLEVSYIQLDNNSEDSNKQVIFSIILPLGTTILNKVDGIFDMELKNLTSTNFHFFSVLINGVYELLETSKSQLQEQKISITNESQQGIKNDFFTSVFSSNSQRTNKLTAAKNRLSINEQLIEQFYTIILKRFYNIWIRCNSRIEELNKSKEYNNKSLVLIIQNYKHKIKTFLQQNYNKNYELFLRILITNSSEKWDDLVSLILSLDGNKPILTIPSVISLMHQDFKILYLSFVKEYLQLLESSAIEEVYSIILNFLKEKSPDSHVESVLSIEIASSLGLNTKFETNKEAISYYELLGKLLDNFKLEVDGKFLGYELAIKNIIPLLGKDSSDILLNTIYNKFVAPLFKEDLYALNDTVLRFLIAITSYLSANKHYKSNILSICESNNFQIFSYNAQWKIFFAALLDSPVLQAYPIEIIGQLLNNKNTFNWSKQEIINKNIIFLQKLALIVDIKSYPQLSSLLAEYALRNIDFNQIKLYLAQITLLNIILMNRSRDNLQLNLLELVELLSDNLRSFQHYYIHSKGSLNDLKETDDYDSAFCGLLKLISTNMAFFKEEDGLWSETYNFKELIFVSEKQEEIDCNRFVVENVVDIERFILVFDRVLKKDIYDF